MIIYNQTDQDVAAFLYPSLATFERGVSLQDTPAIRAYMGYTVPANGSREFSPKDYLLGHYDKNDKYAVAIFDSGWTELTYYLKNNIDDLLVGIYANYGGPAASLNQTQRGVQAVYDLFVDQDAGDDLLGFQDGVRDKDGWVVFWGRDYEATTGNDGQPDLQNSPATVVDKVNSSHCTAASLASFGGELRLFTPNNDTQQVLVRTAGYPSGLDRAQPQTVRINGDTPLSTNKAVIPLLLNDQSLYLFYKNLSGDKSVGCLSTSNASAWEQVVAGIPGTFTDEAPAVARYNNRTYVAFKDRESDQIKLVSSADHRNWTTPTIISGTSTDDAPALTAFGEYSGHKWLVLGYKKKNSGRMYTLRFDGASWSEPEKVPHDSTSKSPQLITKSNMMYLAFRGETSNSLYLKHFDGSTWGRARELESNVDVDHHVTLLDTGDFGVLYATYDHNSHPRVATIKGLIA